MKLNMRIRKPSRKNQALMVIGLVGLATTGTLMATAPSHDAKQVEEKTYPVTTMPVVAQDLAPEFKQGRDEAIDERTDIFCLGGILYRTLTGRTHVAG